MPKPTSRIDASARPTFILRLRPEPGVADAIRALRAALKVLLRRHGLRCLAIEACDHAASENRDPEDRT